MKTGTTELIAAMAALTLSALTSSADVAARTSTLADAPFRLTLPGGDWHFEGDGPTTVSTNLTRVAYATNTTELRTVVLEEKLNSASTNKLDQFAAVIEAKLTNNNIKVSVANTSFAGLPARLLTYAMKIGDAPLYTDTILLVVGNSRWTISAIGPANR